MIWEAHTCIWGLTADNAYRSKIQAVRSKELPAEIRDRIVSRHRSGESYKKWCYIEGSQEHSGSHYCKREEVLNNQDSSKSCPPGQTEQSGEWGLGEDRWPRIRCSVCLSSRNPVRRWKKLPPGNSDKQSTPDFGFMAECPDGSLSSVKDTRKSSWS